NYIIRDDATGRRFAAALSQRAQAGVTVRVLYDALGCRATARGFWRALRAAGVEVRAFRPLLGTAPAELLQRDHRKLLVVDGVHAMTGGACIGDEWAGVGRAPWRDTMVAVDGPAAAALDLTFAAVWRRAGPPLPPDELASNPEPRGDAVVRVVEGIPGRSRTYRADQLLAATAAERLWLTDAYFFAPPPLFASILGAARDGVDVRLLLPSASDIPVLRNFTRMGYRDLLRGRVRVFEWRGPMLHAKTLLVDRRWARIGSSNLNVSSLLLNYELDLLVEDVALVDELAAQFRRDLGSSVEILLSPRRFLPPRLVGTPAPAPGPGAAPRRRRTGYGLGAVAAVTLHRLAGGLRRALAGTIALTFGVIGALLLVFPRVTSVLLAAAAFLVAGAAGWYVVARRRGAGGEEVEPAPTRPVLRA
ncbi:MAG: phospholipase D-like domain-containing protein, partial [Gemmatimonadales bacterium]